MNRVRKHKGDFILLFSILILMAIGLIIIYSIGPMRAKVLNSAYGMDYSSDYFFKHHLLSIAIALVLFFGLYKFVPYRFISKYSKIGIIIALAMSGMLWVFAKAGSSLAICELGACRWYRIGSLSFQPAEFLKIAMVFYLSALIAQKKAEGTIGSFKEFWVPIMIVCGLGLFFVVVLQSDLGTGLSLLAIILGILLISGVSLKQYLLMLGIIAMLGVIVIISSPYRMERVSTFVGNGDSATSYHVENAELAIGTGGLFGVGIGNSVQATGYLPESINDSVFAILGETFGFVGLLVILGIFATLMNRILKVAEYSEDLEYRLVAAGMFSWIAMHVAANIMSMTGLIPVTGVTLPLLSYGGTSIMFVSIGLGAVMQLSCYTSREVKNNENTSSRRGIRGSYNSSRSGGSRNPKK